MEQVKCIFRGNGTYIATGILDSLRPATDTLMLPVDQIESIQESYGITDVFFKSGVVTIFDHEAATVLNAMRENYAHG